MRQSFYQRNYLTSSKRKVYIVLSGWIVVKDHDEDVLLPKTMAKYTSGDIIGAQRLDEGLSNRTETFFLALVDTEIAIMNEDDFYRLWEFQKIAEYEKLIIFIKSNPFFSEFSLQTIYLIVYELIEKKANKSQECKK